MGNAAAQTAVGPMTIVAVDQHEEVPLVRDKLAYRVLPTGAKAVAAFAWLAPVRRWVITATEQKIPGLWSSMLCRKRYIDDQVRAVSFDGIDAVVILGAGLDTRAYRLPYLSATPCYEVDLPENIDHKRSLVRKLYGKIPEHVTLVPIDFETQELADVLAAYGYDSRGRTVFVWEAVTQYLTEGAIRRIFEFLETARTGSRLVFTYVRKDFLDGEEFYGAEEAHRDYVVTRRLWHFGWDPGQMPGFLAEYNWRQIEQAGPREFADRYLDPRGRGLSASEVELSVLAERT